MRTIIIRIIVIMILGYIVRNEYSERSTTVKQGEDFKKVHTMHHIA